MGHREATASVSASLVRTLFLCAAGRLCSSRSRGGSRAGELGNAWSCEWLGAPWRVTLLGKARQCFTSEGVAAEHICLGPPLGRPTSSPRSSLTLNSSTHPWPQLQFTTGCSGAPPVTMRFRLGTSSVNFELQGLRIEKSKQDHRSKFKITQQSHFHEEFTLG